MLDPCDAPWILSMPVMVSLDCVIGACGVLFILSPFLFSEFGSQVFSTCAIVAIILGPSETFQPESSPSRMPSVDGGDGLGDGQLYRAL